MLWFKLLEAIDAESFHLLLDVEELLSFSDLWIQVQGHQLRDGTADDVTVKNVFVLLQNLVGIVGNEWNTTSGCQLLV